MIINILAVLSFLINTELKSMKWNLFLIFLVRQRANYTEMKVYIFVSVYV
jgi:hypothetical protein